MRLADKNNLDFDEVMGIPEKEVDERFVKAVEIAKEISRAKGKPTCEYDIEKKAPYLLYPDGHREYNVGK